MTEPSTSDVATASSGDNDFLVHALIGGVVSVVLSFVPFAPILGGAVAGYLHERDGLRVGSVSGLLAAIPLALVVVLVVVLGFGFFGVFAIAPGGGVGVPGGFVLLLLFGVVLAAVYTVALSAVGGILGVYLVDEL
jgi:hypothetical protein